MPQPFQISPSSIPSKIIRFKIQDVRQIGFGNRNCRFTQDKSALTSQFIDSFANFQSKTQPQSPSSKQDNYSTLRKSPRHSPEDPQNKFQYITPNHKKHLQLLYDRQIKESQTKQKQSQHQLSQPASKAYSFSKARSRENLQFSKLLPNQMLQEEHAPTRQHPKRSAVFQQEDRWAYFDREGKQHSKMGPGEYQTTPNKQRYFNRRIPLQPKTVMKESVNKTSLLEPKRVQYILDMLLPPMVPQSPSQQVKKNISPSHMFASDDRDRFGMQKYPIAKPFYVPAPGEYQLGNGTIQHNLNKLLVLEEQKKLLKLWFDS